MNGGFLHHSFGWKDSMAFYSTTASVSSSFSPPPPSATASPTSRYIRRPAHKVDTREKARNWRAHAVSLNLGEYPPMEDEDDYHQQEEYNTEIASSSKSTTTTASPSSSASSASSSWKDEEMQVALQAQEIQQNLDEQKKRWIENAKPPLRKPVIDERGRAYGRGGRKTAAARVWIQPGLGHVVINHQDLVDYFDRTTDRELVLAPLTATSTCGKFDVTALVTGGGLTGQAGAIRHGLARALNHYNPDVYRPPLKRLGYLTRDPRKVERKKIGHIKARKKPQWVKR